ncbi:hypothetical protein [Crystallibacter crystallopoietes]|uniref:hypothetical protein n=1 Tax=Crystallibacter crystallopoietes TaxID=37928 RepID=UPI00123797F5|nr:hypothetical protein [Arthrobacter crystallopoietes]
MIRLPGEPYQLVQYNPARLRLQTAIHSREFHVEPFRARYTFKQRVVAADRVKALPWDELKQYGRKISPAQLPGLPAYEMSGGLELHAAKQTG